MKGVGRNFHTVVALHIAYTMSRSSRHIQGGILQNKEKNQPPFSPPSIWQEGGNLTRLKESQQNTTEDQYPPIFNEPHPNRHNPPGKCNWTQPNGRPNPPENKVAGEFENTILPSSILANQFSSQKFVEKETIISSPGWKTLAEQWNTDFLYRASNLPSCQR